MLLSSEQSDFRALHSTVSCLLKITDDWYSALHNSELVGVVFIDLKKPLTLSTIPSYVINCDTMESWGMSFFGSNLTFPTGSSVVE